MLIRPSKGVTLLLQQNLFDFSRCIAAKVINKQSDFESSCFSKVWRTNFSVVPSTVLLQFSTVVEITAMSFRICSLLTQRVLQEDSGGGVRNAS